MSLGVAQLLALCLLSLVTAPNTSSDTTPPLPEDLKTLIDQGDMEAANALVNKRLKEHLGEPFPNLLLRGRGGRETHLYDVLSSRTVLFLAVADLPGSIEIAHGLRKNGWKVSGYDRIVTLVLTVDAPTLRKQLPSLKDVYLIDWPLPSYLVYSASYPVLFFVSSDGTFEGFQRHTLNDPVYRIDDP